MCIPRPEHPFPQFERSSWLNLNGEWEFELDLSGTGREQGFLEKKAYSRKILVPFCPESELSGIGYKDFMEAVWYRRSFLLPPDQTGKRTLLHISAADYKTEVWINGLSAGVHEGGYVSFSFDITDFLVPGDNVITICCEDHQRSGRQPFGKQSDRFHSYACSYTRTTGIWQTIWLEWVPQSYMETAFFTTDPAQGICYADVLLKNNHPDEALSVKISALEKGVENASACAEVCGDHAYLTLKIQNPKLWEPLNPYLYDLSLELWKDGQVIDRVKSYIGLRSISFEGKACQINGKTVFQRLVLDQGFYPDGIYTAPSEADLRQDIEMSIAMGFNGARLHQKVFEPRFLYLADRLGYLCWGEYPSWGIDPSRSYTLGIVLKEWIEVVQRDYNHPSIIGWCPFNEVWGESGDGLRELTLRSVYRATKAIDRTRPVIDTSGGLHTETDVYDTHDYEQNVQIFAARYAPGAPLYDRLEPKEHYDGIKPMFVSEYGGIRWTDDASGWGYGEGPKTEEEYLERYRGLTTALLANPEHMGFCYTQLTDVEQEQNGLYTYHRKPKFPPEVIAAINRQKAAIET